MIEYLDNGFILNSNIEELNLISFQIFFVKTNERFIDMFQFIKKISSDLYQKISPSHVPIENLTNSSNFFICF